MPEAATAAGRGSMDVPVEIGGAPDHNHPDRQHETDAKGCKHFQFPPCRIVYLGALSQGSSLFYDKPGARTIPVEIIREWTPTAMAIRRGRKIQAK
jgi:hypothetical protein